MEMHIDREDLDEAAARRIVDPAQAAALWRFLEERHPGRARFTGFNVAYYPGSLGGISALGWLMTLGFPRMGPWAVCLTPGGDAACFVSVGARLWATPDLKIPRG